MTGSSAQILGTSPRLLLEAPGANLPEDAPARVVVLESAARGTGNAKETRTGETRLTLYLTYIYLGKSSSEQSIPDCDGRPLKILDSARRLV